MFKCRFLIRVLLEYMGLASISGDQHNTEKSSNSENILVFASLNHEILAE